MQPTHKRNFLNEGVQVQGLNDLLVYEMRDLFDAEHQFLELMPIFADAASTPALKELIAESRSTAETQIANLGKGFEHLGVEATRGECLAMWGLVQETNAMLSRRSDPMTLDAAILGSINRIQHHEIAGYRTIAAFAEALGDQTLMGLFRGHTRPGLVIDQAASVLVQRLAIHALTD